MFSQETMNHNNQTGVADESEMLTCILYGNGILVRTLKIKPNELKQKRMKILKMNNCYLSE